MIIRTVRRSDAGAIEGLVAGLHRYPAHRAPGIWSRGSPRAILGAMMGDRAVHLLIAEENGVPQAYVAGKFELRPKGQPRRVGHIMQSFVKPGLRGRGVGTALVTALLDWFRKRRVEDVSLRYVVGNRRAEQFWKGLGFRPLIVTANARPEVIGRRLARFRARLSRAR